MRLLFLRARGPLRFFKRVRIGLRLFKQSIATIVFDHHRYFLFCTLLALVRFFRIQLISFIDPQFSISYAVTESLMGQSFFTILFSKQEVVRTFNGILIFIIKIALFYLELFITFSLMGAVTYYTFYSKRVTFFESIQQSFKQWKKISIWACSELTILFITSLLGILGDFLEFGWSLSTALVISLIMFEPLPFKTLIKDTFILFKQRFGNIVGTEVFTESALIVLTFLFYYLYRDQQTPLFDFLQPTQLHSLTLIVLFYLNSVIVVTETITFTLLYKIIVSRKSHS